MGSVEEECGRLGRRGPERKNLWKRHSHCQSFASLAQQEDQNIIYFVIPRVPSFLSRKWKAFLIGLYTRALVAIAEIPNYLFDLQ